MAHELFIEPEAFKKVLAQRVQNLLHAACLPAALGQYVDHVDAVGVEIAFFVSADGVRVWMPLDVFIVSEADLLASPNATPEGCQTAAGRAILALELSINGTVLMLQPLEVARGTLPAETNEFLARVQADLVAALGTPLRFDFAPALAALGLPTPARSRVTLANSGPGVPLDKGHLVVSFESEEAAPPLRAAGGQQWGWFSDVESIQSMLDRMISMPGWQKTLHWRGGGWAPHADIELKKSHLLPQGFVGEALAKVALAIDFDVVAAPLPVLRATISWSIDIELHTNFGGLLEGVVESALTAFVVDEVARREFNPTRFGGVPVGDHVFVVDLRLPSLALSGATLGYASAFGWPDGMTLGGPVRLPTASGYDTVRVAPTPFTRLYGPPAFCKGPRRVGPPLLGEVSTSASAWMEGSDHICAFTVVSPAFPIDAYISGIDTTMLWVSLPAIVALQISEPLRLIVRTPRGTRLVELGVPPHAEVDAQGRVTNAVRDNIDDCDYISRDLWRQLTTQIDTFGQGPVHVPGFDDGPVPGLPGGGTPWSRLWADTQAAVVQVITVTDLAPGEMIRFTSAHHQATVSADAHGTARLPVFMPLRSRRPETLRGGELLRVNRQSLQGRVSTRSLALLRETALALDDAPPQVEQVAQADAHIDLTALGVLSVLAMPGFAQAELALGITADGSTLILDLGSPGTVRVAGEMSGPVGPLRLSGERASVPGLAGSFRIQAHGSCDGCECGCEMSSN